ncbi:MAG: hypothetical protein SH856_04530 [Flavobacteriales bacterium]|nr:hypothetical protein [Flavobacteriales bacterium]
MKTTFCIALLGFMLACGESATQPSTDNAPPESATNPVIETTGGDLPIQNTTGTIEKTWIFSSVQGYQNGVVNSDTTGMHLFNNAMKGIELAFANGTFTKKSGSTNSTGTYSISGDNRTLELVESGTKKEFAVIELTEKFLKLQSPQLPTVVVAYKAK